LGCASSHSSSWPTREGNRATVQRFEEELATNERS
jgi:hypothetical protein